MIPRLESHTPLVRIEPSPSGYIMVIEQLASDFYGYPCCSIEHDGKKWKKQWHAVHAGAVYRQRPAYTLFIDAYPGQLSGSPIENAQVVEDHLHNTFYDDSLQKLLVLMQTGWLISENHLGDVWRMNKSGVMVSNEDVVITKAAIPGVEYRRRLLVEMQWMANGL